MSSTRAQGDLEDKELYFNKLPEVVQDMDGAYNESQNLANHYESSTTTGTGPESAQSLDFSNPHIWINNRSPAIIEREESHSGSLHSTIDVEEPFSQQSPSVGSVADSDESASISARTAQRNYLSPLRSKHYDELRSSLLSPSGFNGTKYLQNRSRSSSSASILRLSELAEVDDQAMPKQAIKWSRLRKLTDQLYSESGNRAFGKPTCFIVSGILAIGTTKGLILVFDYQQICKKVIGNGTIAATAGAVSSLAISADHTCIAAGHENGSIFSWELWKSSSPVQYIPSKVVGVTDQNGHLQGSKIIHLNYVSTRHSAFISADSTGMVFYHNCRRKLLKNGIETTRITGRQEDRTSDIRFKPSTIYKSMVLPLGNVSYFTDSVGLVAILTPHKLVVISTMPVARTQFNMKRPSGILAQADTLSGSAAWLPAIEHSLGDKDMRSKVTITPPRLACVWCSKLFLFEVVEDPTFSVAVPVGFALPKVELRLSKEFDCRQGLVGVQWYSSNILCLLTKSGEMRILDTNTLTIIGDCDLLSKNLVHRDVHAEQLRSYFEEREAEYVDQSFADSFGQSFQVYRSKLFILGAHELSVGTLLTWEDKISAFTTAGQHIEAIELLKRCYSGVDELGLIGLPENLQARQRLVTTKLYKLMLSSAKYSIDSEDLALRSDQHLDILLKSCFEACLSLENTEFLMNEIWDVYDEGGRPEPFLRQLASNILEDHIKATPAAIVQRLVEYYTTEKLHTRLEDIICHLEPSSLDINQITILSNKYHLYNALAYISTEAMHDFVGPLVKSFDLIKAVLKATKEMETQQDISDRFSALGVDTVNAVKVFSYLSLTLTGRVFPLATLRASDLADFGKAQVYDAIFSDTNILWPPESTSHILTSGNHPEPMFPYIRLLLFFDVPTFLASMDEAFEDPYLNDARARKDNQSQRQVLSTTRQFIINILLEVMATGFTADDTIYLYMFIARNVPKYPQFILLSGSALQKIILGLCHYTDPELAEDCQLSVEYLLSVYKPSDTSQMLCHYTEARFFRVLKASYRAENRWTELVVAHLQDAHDDGSIFDCIAELLGADNHLSTRQRVEVEDLLVKHIVQIATLDGSRTARTLQRYTPNLQRTIYEALLSQEGLLYIYLRQLLETDKFDAWVTMDVVEKYIDLLCVYDRQHLSDFIRGLDLDAIDMNRVVQNLEQYDLFDLVVYLMSAQGKRVEALSRVLNQVLALQESDFWTPASNPRGFVTGVVAFQEYAATGSSLCEAECASAAKRSHSDLPNDNDLSLARFESMWVSLILGLVEFYTWWRVQSLLGDRKQEDTWGVKKDGFKIAIQGVFSRCLNSTHSRQPQSIVRVVQAWLHSLASTQTNMKLTIALLRDIFDSYEYYSQLLALADKLLARDSFKSLAGKESASKRGWKVLTPPTCSVCGEKLYDVKSYGAVVKEHQRARMLQKEYRRSEELARVEQLHGLRRRNLGKRPVERDEFPGTHHMSVHAGEESVRNRVDDIISYACGHAVHESCYKLKRAQSEDDLIRCPQCIALGARELNEGTRGDLEPIVSTKY